MFHILTLLFFLPFFLPFSPFIWTSPSNLKVFTSNVKAVSLRAREQGFPLPIISMSPDYSETCIKRTPSGSAVVFA